MKNPQVKASVKRRIDKSVGRLLADLRGLDPPLDLVQVRNKLKLDLHYYSGKDPGHFRQFVHTMKVAGREYLRRRKKLSWIIKKLGLKGFLFWHSNEIHIDSDLHHIKYRWAECHEIGHKLCEWHKHYLLGDSNTELSPVCHAKIEAEANYTSGQLLFMQERFVEELMGVPLSIVALQEHSQTFGNSKATTLWRMVEEFQGSHAVVGIVSGHPYHPSDDFDPLDPCRYVIQSDDFRSKFSNITEVQLFGTLKAYCGYQKGGSLGTKEVELLDDNGERREFVFESFCFKFRDKSKPGMPMGYQVLTLGVEKRRITTVVSPTQVEAVRNASRVNVG